MDQKKVLCVIPARGGSKGLPGKNILPLNGKPTIAWTIERALDSELITDVVVSTDSKDIAEVALGFGAKVPFIRPADLAQDTSSTIPVVEHAISYLLKNQKCKYEYILLAEPTSPLRYKYDFDAALESLFKNSKEFDSLVSLGPVKTHPALLKKMDGNSIRPYYEVLENNTRRQDLDDALFPFGVAYIAKTDVLLEEKTFYTKRCMGYIIKENQCFEIDDIIDFRCIEAMFKSGEFS